MKLAYDSIDRARDELGLFSSARDDCAVRVAREVERVEPGAVVLVVAVVEEAALVLGPRVLRDPARVARDLAVMREALAFADARSRARASACAP